CSADCLLPGFSLVRASVVGSADYRLFSDSTRLKMVHMEAVSKGFEYLFILPLEALVLI
ncbi:hypothetical protein C0J52_01386, partial [Blattella germanica]